ncbi:GNAT family N-acetyltransferase [Streptomyces sp. SAS_270]|uniref:GNAT family N-acetyltransferase n=1 Tax=Streptomyces sp. SAS_270 TaxID=3412748 RepID=UPI00403C8050
MSTRGDVRRRASARSSPSAPKRKRSSRHTSGDEVAAYIHTEEWPAGGTTAATREGWIARLGTRRPYRGRGLATTLLVRTLHARATDGLTSVGLEVGPRNPTAPLTIYLRTNSAVTARLTEYQLTED